MECEICFTRSIIDEVDSSEMQQNQTQVESGATGSIIDETRS